MNFLSVEKVTMPNIKTLDGIPAPPLLPIHLNVFIFEPKQTMSSFKVFFRHCVIHTVVY